MQRFSRVRGVIRCDTLFPDAIDEVRDRVHLWPQEREFFTMIEMLGILTNDLCR